MAGASRGEHVGVADFGARAIRVMFARRDADGSVHILGHGEAPGRGCVSQGVIQDLSAAKDAFRKALQAAEKQAQIKLPALFCGVHGKHVETFIREGNVSLEDQAVEDAHMDEARDIASRDILAPGKRVTASVSAQEWYVDELRVLDPKGIRGQVLKTRVHFARLPAVIEDNILACVESQQREIEDLIFLPIAASLGCLTPEDMELGAGVLDLGRSTTGLAVYRDHRIMGTSCFEWGGYHLTRDVAAGLQVSFEEACELVLEYGIPEHLIWDEAEGEDGGSAGESPPQPEQRRTHIKLKTAVPGAASLVEREQLDMIIHARARELLMHVRQHLHNRGLTRNLVRGVVLTGGASMIKNYVKLAEAVFQTPCRIGRPIGIESLPAAVQTPDYSAAVGIIRHAFAYRTIARNGLHPESGLIAHGVRQMGALMKKYFF